MVLRYVLNASVDGDSRLRLAFAGGEERIVDFKPVIERGGVFTQLCDSQFFARVSVSKDGRYIEWPGEIDFCADALWLEGARVASAASQSPTL